MKYEVTIFRNISSTATPYHKDVTVVLERIKSGVDLHLVNQIRFEKDKEKRNSLKRGLPSICFSGKFRQRSASGLIKPSGLIALDFDGYKNQEELLLHKKAFESSKEKSKYTFACFISPSNLGLKVIVKIPPSEKDHKAYFKALQEFYNNEHFDASTSDVSRVCYSSADSTLYYNPDSEIWTEMEHNESYDLAHTVPVLKLKTDIGIVSNLQKWFDKKYNMSEGDRNNSLFKFASAFNDFGVSQAECERYLQNKYKSKTFPEREILTLIKSAYKKPGGTKFFEDKQALDLIERQIRSGIEKKKIYKKLAAEGGHSEDDVDSAIKIVEGNVPISEFWYYTDKGACKIKSSKLKAFLEQNGYYKYYPEGSDSYVFIKIENNMIENVTPAQIKDFVTNYLYSLTNLAPYEVMVDAPKYFKDDYLNMIDAADIKFYEDTIDKAVVYFKNGAAIISTTSEIVEEQTIFGKEKKEVKHTKKVELLDYMTLNGYVWRKAIINRDYIHGEFEGCVYDKFIGFISGGNKDKIMSIKSTIGYLLHSFKTSANNKAVILNDETISDNPNGGSGKGIFCAALGHMTNVAILNGKTFDSSRSFAYQTIQVDTRILVYDDIPKNFPFESLFSVVTEGITLEKKNKDAIKLPVGKSPKILITTNYTIGGVGGSFDRRKWEVEFSSHFNSNHTPLQEFGHQLFDEWPEEEWIKFDNFMIDCVRVYLENGLIKQEFTNLAERKFIKETSFDFHEWITEEPLPMHTRLYKPQWFQKFTNEYPDYLKNKWFTNKRFSMWLDIYGKYKGHKTMAGKDMEGRWIMFVAEGASADDVKEIAKSTEPVEAVNLDRLYSEKEEDLGF